MVRFLLAVTVLEPNGRIACGVYSLPFTHRLIFDALSSAWYNVVLWDYLSTFVYEMYTIRCDVWAAFVWAEHKCFTLKFNKTTTAARSGKTCLMLFRSNCLLHNIFRFVRFCIGLWACVASICLYLCKSMRAIGMGWVVDALCFPSLLYFFFSFAFLLFSFLCRFSLFASYIWVFVIAFHVSPTHSNQSS